MFDESERRHPIQEEERIKVENIRGKIIFIGAEDDVLLGHLQIHPQDGSPPSELPHECAFESWLYDHGTHFAFPESMLKMMLPRWGPGCWSPLCSGREKSTEGMPRNPDRYRPEAEKGLWRNGRLWQSFFARRKPGAAALLVTSMWSKEQLNGEGA